ncbi:MAG: hypothetical protein ACI91B_003426 [Planctomycetota bacterium]|jgi:hypothetical protein
MLSIAGPSCVRCHGELSHPSLEKPNGAGTLVTREQVIDAFATIVENVFDLGHDELRLRMSIHIDLTSVAATRSRATALSLQMKTGPASSSS